MANQIIEGMTAYSKMALRQLYIQCKTAFLSNPEDLIYTVKGKETKVREISAGTAGDYDPSKGWGELVGSGDSVRWIPYYAPFDRLKIIRVDSNVELASYQEGAQPSIVALNEDFLERVLPREVDATNISTWYNRVPDGNRHTVAEAGFGISDDSILGTITRLEKLVFDSGWDGDTALFISSDVDAAIQAAVQNKTGLANQNVIREAWSFVVESRDKSEALEITVNVIRINKMILITVPSDRMYSHIIMLSGRQDDPGQEYGGYVKNVSDPGCCDIKLLAIPLPAGFTSIKYMVENYLYPGNFPGLDGTKTINTGELNKKLYGNVAINNAGINQKADAFEYDIRVIYGGDIFNNRRQNCFAVTSIPGAGTPITNIALAVENGGQATVPVGGTLNVEATLTPDAPTVSEIGWLSEPGTGTIAVNKNGVVYGIAPGTATVKAQALDGSGVVGELEITVTPAIAQ